MALTNYFRKAAGNAADILGSTFNLPDVGLSERIAGGNTLNSNQFDNVRDRTVVNGLPDAARSLGNYFSGSGGNTLGIEGESGANLPARPTDINGDGTVSDDEIARYFAAASQAASGSAGGSSAQPGRLILNGRDFGAESDPTARKNYFDAANAENVGIADQTYGRQVGSIRQNKENLDYTNARYLQQLKAKREQLMQEKENYFSEAEKQGKDFVTGKSLGDTKRQNYFGGLGANSFQSSQATSQGYADDQFLTGLAEQQKAKAQAEQKFGYQASQFDDNEADTARQYQQDANSYEQALGDAKFQRDNYVNQGKNSLLGAFSPADVSQGVDTSRYNVTPYSNVNAEKADLSGFGTYTNFSQAKANPQAATGGTGGFSYSPSNTLKPQENYFGYAPDEEGKSKINKSLSNYFSY